MGGLLRKLTIWICIPIYRLIKSFYLIFYNIANTRFLEDDTIQQLSANIYVLVSVVMLFAFSVTILSAIVNPDLLNDSKKGVAAAFKRAIIGLALMVVIPFAFDEIYAVQKNIMDNSLIEKIIVGADFRCDQNEEGNCTTGGNGGQVIAGNLISSVLYPVTDNVQISENISEKYEKMITTDIRYIGAVAKHINVTTEGDNAYRSDFDDDDYAFNWDGLVAIIAGGATCYILLLFAIDMAIRVFKLAFLELTAPISIVAYMASGDKILKSWGQEVLKTFLDVFVRIAAIAFYLFLIKNLSTYMAKFEGAEWSFILKVLLIVGMLIFVKQIPDLINNIFKTSLSLKGGIGGRLGEMAVVGKQAQAAWGAVKQAAKLGAGAVGLGLASVANPAAALGLGLAHHGWNKGFKKLGARAGKETATGKFLTSAGKTAGAYLKGNGLKSGLTDAKKAYSESDFGLERIANKNYKEAVKNNEEFNKKMGFNDYGQSTNAEKDLATFDSNVKKDLGKSQAQAVQKLNTANLKKATVDQISSDKDAIISELDALRTNAKTTEAVNAIEGIKNSFAKGNMSSNEMRTKLNGLIDAGEIDSSSGLKISGKLDSIENTLDNNIELKKALVGANGELKVGTNLKELKTGAEKAATIAKSNYDTVYNGSSESAKKEMDNYVAASDEIVSKYVKEKGKANNKPENINTVGTHYDGSKEKENDGEKRVEIHQTEGIKNVEHTTLQENIDRAANVHDAPTREEHISRQADYNDLFNSDAGSRYLDANEREDDRIHGTSNENGNNTTNSGAGSSNENANNTTNAGGSSSSVNVEGLDDLFNNLNKTITNASDGTNKILQDQLNEQKNMSSELKNQTNSINNVGNKLNEFKSDVSNSFNDIKKKMDDSDK